MLKVQKSCCNRSCICIQPKKQPVYDLLNVPDDQLTPEEVATKKRQYILKKAREGREKAQAKQREKRQKVIGD